MTALYRPCWVDIDLAALSCNFQTLKKRLSPSVQILAVVKADAYGHGLAPVARLALREGAAWLGVSSIEEGVALRRGGVKGPTLILGSLYPFDGFPVLF